MFVEEQDRSHRNHQDDGRRLAHLKRPRNVRQVVEHHVGKRRIPIHVGDSVMDNHHHKSGEHEDKEHVDVADEELDKLRMEMT